MSKRSRWSLKTPAQKARDLACQKRWRQANRERVNEANQRRKAKYRPKRSITDKAYSLRRKYRLTIAERDAMEAAQGGRCAICRQPDGKLYVDHCHSAKRVRALLCKRCNWGLGSFKDNAVFLRRAAYYLDRFNKLHHNAETSPQPSP